jgi:glycosyltransferase involved in cell wall biosynthesis
MPEVYACADAAVVASHGECPLTVLEALSSGLPVVLRDDPALHSPWTAGPGVRFVRMRPGELRAALEELLDRPAAARADGRRGREHVEGSFDWERHVDRLAERYRSLVGAEPSRPAGRSMRAPA